MMAGSASLCAGIRAGDEAGCDDGGRSGVIEAAGLAVCNAVSIVLYHSTQLVESERARGKRWPRSTLRASLSALRSVDSTRSNSSTWQSLSCDCLDCSHTRTGPRPAVVPPRSTP